jgi:hypothetical protein
VKKELAEGRLQALTPQEAFYPLHEREKLSTQAEQFALIKAFEFEEIN